MKNTEAGFTLVEILITIGFIGIAAAGVSSMFIGIQTIQRNTSYTDIATRAGQREIESLRSSNYSSLTPGQTIDFSSQVSSILPGRTATAVISEPSTDIRRIDTTVTYITSGQQHSVKLSSLIGAIGLTK